MGGGLSSLITLAIIAGVTWGLVLLVTVVYLCFWKMKFEKAESYKDIGMLCIPCVHCRGFGRNNGRLYFYFSRKGSGKLDNLQSTAVSMVKLIHVVIEHCYCTLLNDINNLYPYPYSLNVY